MKATETTGHSRKVRIEAWYTRSQAAWLKGVARYQDRSVSSLLRRIVDDHIRNAIAAARERREVGSRLHGS